VTKTPLSEGLQAFQKPSQTREKAGKKKRRFLTKIFMATEPGRLRDRVVGRDLQGEIKVRKGRSVFSHKIGGRWAGTTMKDIKKRG